MTARFKDHLLGPDTHANLPDPATTPEAAIYECTTHGKIYKNVSATWIDYGVLIPPGGTTGQALVKNSGTDGDVGWGSGGGGGSTIEDRRWTAAATSTVVDEFNDAALDAAWVRVDGANAPAANLTWTEDADVLSAKQTASDTGNAMHGLVRPLTGAGGAMATGDAFVTCFSLWGEPTQNYAMAGLMLADGATYGAGLQLTTVNQINNTTSGMVSYIIREANWTTQSAASQERTSLPGLIYHRLVYLGGTSWRFDQSIDGVSWLKGTAITYTSFTPTHVGLMTSMPAGVAARPFIASFEFLRRVAGIT